MVGEIPILGRLVTMIPRSRLPSMMSAIKVSYPSLICIGGTDGARVKGEREDARKIAAGGFRDPFLEITAVSWRKKKKHESFRHRGITNAIILPISFDRIIFFHGFYRSVVLFASGINWSSMTRGNSNE